MEHERFQLPPLDRFTLPQALEHLEVLDCRREHLIVYLQDGRLKAICYPFRKDRCRSVPISPEEWREHYRDPYEFSPYYGWFGENDEAQLGRKDPLHLLPRSVEARRHEKDDDGEPIVESSVVYIEHSEMVRFIHWLKNSMDEIELELQDSGETRAETAPRRGRPPKYDYSEIDPLLEQICAKRGRQALNSPASVINELEAELGTDNLPARDALSAHVRRFREKRARRR